MILSITLNPCIDKSAKVEQLKPETKLRCTEIVNEPGGGGINVSKGLKKLGIPATALLPAGGHNGNMLCSLLKEEGVPFHALETNAETRENWIILETSTNRQFRFTFPGRPVPEESVRALIDQLRAFSPGYVVASGSLPPGLPDYFYGLIVKHTAEAGAKCIVDTSGNALQALKGKHAYLIKPNIGELCRMLNIGRLEMNDVPRAAQQAIQDGYAKIIVVSMGPQGAWLVTASEEYFVNAPVVEKKSTVGAGDSMVAGIVSYLEKGAPLAEVLRFGVACGTAATMNEGTRLFEKEDAEKLYKILCEK